MKSKIYDDHEYIPIRGDPDGKLDWKYTALLWQNRWARKPELTYERLNRKIHDNYATKTKNSLKLALIGDSYCADVYKTPYKTWPYIVAENLNASIISLGRSGAAMTHSYEDLIAVVDEADVVIVCVTEPNRVPNRYGLPLNIGITSRKKESIISKFLTHAPWFFDQWNKSKEQSKSKSVGIDSMIRWWVDEYGIPEKQGVKILDSLNKYYESLWDPDLMKIVHKGVLMQIDELLLKKNKKCFWFPCFGSSGIVIDDDNSIVYDDPYVPYGEIDKESRFHPKSGPVANMPLLLLSMHELMSTGLGEKYCNKLIGEHWDEEDIVRLSTAGYTDKKRSNHFGSEYNKYFANMILTLLSEDKQNGIIDIPNYFPFTKRQLKWLKRYTKSRYSFHCFRDRLPSDLY